MNYKWYEEDISKAWVINLQETFNEIQDEVFKHTGKWLKVPNFCVNPNLNWAWGLWEKSNRTITLSTKLLRNYEWAAVKYVMKHEVAHLMVDELFVVEHFPHGEAWKRACTILNIDPNVTTNDKYLSQFKGGSVSPIVDKIQKLLAHGNDISISTEESQLFLNKAQELIIKYNVSLNSNSKDNNFFTIRPVGPLVDGHRAWLSAVSGLVASYYNVSCIWMYCNEKRRMEFFGTPENLDVAEYVFHALLTQAESLWEQYKENHNEKAKNDPNYLLSIGTTYRGNAHRISKASFMRGLVNGYNAKLRSEKRIILDSFTPNDRAVISANDGILKEAYKKHYKPRNLAKSACKGQGYWDGHKAGSSLSLAMGVTSGSGSKILMIA